MTKMSGNYNKDCYRCRHEVGESSRRRRPVLACVEDLGRLSALTTHSRFYNQRSLNDKQLHNDFAAYFQSSRKANDPLYAITSHTARNSPAKRSSVLSTYPVQLLRWDPYVQTTAEEPELLQPPEPPEPPKPEEPVFTCRCETCASKNCPSKAANAKRKFKDNIMTFADQWTMTPRLADAGIGETPIHSARGSDVSVTASNIAVKDTQASMEVRRLTSLENPVPILKRSRQKSKGHSKHRCCKLYPPVIEDGPVEQQINPDEYSDEPERDNADDAAGSKEPSKKSSIKSFFKGGKKKCLKNRRIIYNEGISDVVADQLPDTPVVLNPPAKQDSRQKVEGSSKTSIKSRHYSDEMISNIPHCHRSDSRYHAHCKKSPSRELYFDQDELRRLVVSPHVVRRTYAMRQKYQAPPIKLPKKVLMSDRDIDDFIDRSYPGVYVPVSRK